MDALDLLTKAREIELEELKKVTARATRFQAIRVLLCLLLLGMVVQHSFTPPSWKAGQEAFDKWLKVPRHGAPWLRSLPLRALETETEQKRRAITDLLKDTKGEPLFPYRQLGNTDLMLPMLENAARRAGPGTFNVAAVEQSQRLCSQVLSGIADIRSKTPSAQTVGDLRADQGRPGRLGRQPLARLLDELGAQDGIYEDTAPIDSQVSWTLYLEERYGAAHDLLTALHAEFDAWQFFTREAWEKLTDEDCRAWQRVESAFGNDFEPATSVLQPEFPPVGEGMPLSITIKRIREYLARKDEALKKEGEKATFWGLEVPLPLTWLLFAFPFLYVLSVSTSRLTYTQSRRLCTISECPKMTSRAHAESARKVTLGRVSRR